MNDAQTEELYLGLDGGATTTRAVLIDRQGRVRGEGRSGASNYHNVGIARAGDALRRATEGAWLRAKRPFGPAQAAFVGCAGVKSTIDVVRLRAAAEAAGLAPAGRVTVANDLHNALAGGLAGKPGIAVIAGTGTNCLGRDASGATFMCGGWGWLLDDIGGGVGIALAGLRAAVRAADGRAGATALVAAALAHFGLTEPDEFLARLYAPACPPGELASFAPVVVRLAGQGDAAAAEILGEGARHLAELVAQTTRALDFPHGPQVVVLGGCVRTGAPYQPLVERAIGEIVPRAVITEPAYPPEWGAGLNALAAGGCPRPERLHVA